MISIKEHFEKIIHAYPECFSGTLLLGLSGGIDSTVLFHLLIEYQIKFAVAHCNFQLRGEESELDQSFVQNLAAQHHIECHIKRFQTSEYAKKQGISIQMAARNLRIEFMQELLKFHNYNYICLAHHLDDNIETFFLQLLRGTGMKGLKGMTVLSGNTFRPLLGCTRNEIAEYAILNSLAYREDSSNSKDFYLRNKIRLHVIPAIEQQFPAFRKTMHKNLLNIAQGIDLFESLHRFVAKEFVTTLNNETIIDLQKLHQFENHILLLAEYIAPYHFTHTQAKQIFQTYPNTESKQFQSRSHIAYLKNNRLEIVQKTKSTGKFFLIDSIDAFSNSECPITLKAEIIDYSSDFTFAADPLYAYFDFDAIKFPLTIRKWKKGDRLQPFGMKGTKLISDILTEYKLSTRQKQSVWLLCAENRIIWVIGYKNSAYFQITNQTSKILCLHAQLK